VFTVNYNFHSTSGTVAVDDFVFQVPEPATSALVIVAGVVLIGARRRKAAMRVAHQS
jgi:hypothetical protein